MDFLEGKLADLRSRLRRIQEFKRNSGRSMPNDMINDMIDELQRQIAEVLSLIADTKNKPKD
jgi:hypothetical protein